MNHQSARQRGTLLLDAQQGGRSNRGIEPRRKLLYPLRQSHPLERCTDGLIGGIRTAIGRLPPTVPDDYCGALLHITAPATHRVERQPLAVALR